MPWMAITSSDVVERQPVAVAWTLAGYCCLEVNEALAAPLWHNLVLGQVNVEQTHRLVGMEVDGINGA